jgi:hypothetical protein
MYFFKQWPWPTLYWHFTSRCCINCTISIWFMPPYRIYAVFYDILARWKWFFMNRNLSDLCCIKQIIRYIYVVLKCFHLTNKWRNLFQSLFYFMYHAVCLKFVLRSYHSRYQILLLHSCDNAWNVAHVTKRNWWNICLLVSWFLNNCVRCFYYAYRGAAKMLRVCRAFFIKFNVLTERVGTAVYFYGYCAIGGNNKISAFDFLHSVTTKQRAQRLTSCNDYIT